MKTGLHWPGLCASVGPGFLSWEFEILNGKMQKWRIRKLLEFCPQWCQGDLNSAFCEPRIQPILLSSGCGSKLPQLRWHQTTAIHSLIVLEAGSPKSARLHSLQRPQGRTFSSPPPAPLAYGYITPTSASVFASSSLRFLPSVCLLQRHLSSGVGPA